MLLAITIFILVFYVFLGVKKAGYALITMPIVVISFFLLAASKDLRGPAMVSLCMVPATLISILFMRHETDVVPWPKTGAKALIMVILTIILLIWFFQVSSLLGSVSFVFIGILFGYCTGVVVTQRNATIAFVISTIGASIRQNLPLPMALQSASEDIKYRHSQILRQISKWLVKGYSLSESIKRGFERCPARITALIAAGEKAGQVPQVVQAIEKDLLEKATDSKRVKPIYPAAYIITLLITMSLIILMISTAILPKFIVVIKEMTGMTNIPNPIPKSTRILIAITNGIFFKYGWLSAIVVWVLFLAVIIYIKVRFRPRRPQKPLMLSRIGDFVKWHLPILHWFENNYSTLQVVEGLRIFLNAGNTINEAIRNTINLDVNCCFRRRLQEWLKKVEAGENIAAAARQCSLANSLSWAFEQQGNPENTLPVLEMLESVYRSNYSYRINLARFILLPCTTICLGVMVGFVAYSILSVMVAIIYQLASLA
jgi:general secretion pathway protein F